MTKNWFILLVAICVIAGAFYDYSPKVYQQRATPAVLRVGVLPDQGVQGLHDRYDPFLKYLARETGLVYELVVPENYSELVQLIGDQAVDLAYLGGLTFLQAHARYSAEPLVMRDVDMRFTSVFLSKSNEASQDIIDYKDKVFSFGSLQSTSGHLMPRHYMKIEKRIVPENFFSEVLFSGAHDKTAFMIRDGRADVGVANSEIIRSMLREGKLKESDVHIIWETPPYPDYVWAVKNNLAEDVKTRIRNAFLGLEIDHVDQQKILAGMGARAFFPTGISDFLPLKKVAESLGLLDQARL